MPNRKLTEEEREKSWYWKNRDRALSNTRARYHKNKTPETTRRNNLQRKYKITIDEFGALLASQGGCCAACKSPNPSSKQGWVVDHNHSTGHVRGILCSHCNLALGHAKDDAQRLQQLIDYLHESNK